MRNTQTSHQNTKASKKDESEYSDESDDSESYTNDEDVEKNQSGKHVYHLRTNLIDDQPDLDTQRRFKIAFRKHEHIPSDLESVILDIEDKNQSKGKQVLESSDFENKTKIKDKLKRTKFSTPYCLYIDKIVSISIPTFILGDRDNDIRIFASFYHQPTKKFFGRTFKSYGVHKSNVANQQKAVDFVVQEAKLTMPIFFHTPVVDQDVYLIIEIVAQRKLALDGRRYVYSKTLNSVHRGTPRALGVIPHEQMKESSYKLGCTIFYSLMRHPMLKEVMHLMRESDMVTNRDIIPGLTTEKPNLLLPKACKHCPIQLHHLTVSLPPMFESKLLKSLEEHRKTEHGRGLDASKAISIEKRTMVIGAHNTFTFLKPPRVIPVEVDATNKGETTSLSFDGSLNFPVFYEHDLCSILLEMQYSVRVPSVVSTSGENLTESRGFNLFSRKPAPTPTVKSNEYEVHEITVGTFIYHPSQKIIDGMSAPVEINLLTGPMRSLLGSLVYHISGQDSSTGKHHIKVNFDLLGTDASVALLSSRSSRPGTALTLGRPVTPTPNFSSRTTTSRKSSINSRPASPLVSPPPSRPSTSKSQAMTSPPSSAKSQVVSPPISRPSTAKSQSVPQIPSGPSTTVKSRASSPAKQTAKPTINLESVEQSITNIKVTPATPASPKQKEVIVEQQAPIVKKQQVAQPKSPPSPRPPTPPTPKKTKEPYILKPHQAPDIPQTFFEKVEVSISSLANRSREISNGIAKMISSVGNFKSLLDDKLNASDDKLSSSTYIPSYNDPVYLSCHEIQIQFLSFEPPKHLSRDKPPSSLYFRFHFFTFAPTNTNATPVHLLNGAQESLHGEQQSFAKILSLSKDGNEHGLISRFLLDSSKVTEEEYNLFKQYLEKSSLTVDVYDSDRMLKYGTVSIPLKDIYRRELEPNKQTTREFDVIERYEEAFDARQDQAEDVTHTVRHKGKLYIRLSNVGKKPISTSNELLTQKKKYESGTMSTKSKINDVGPVKSLAEHKNLQGALSRDISKEDRPSTPENAIAVDELHQRLRTIQLYRKANKVATLKKNLASAMTDYRLMYPMFGRLEFFQITINQNDGSDSIYSIEIQDGGHKGLQIVTDQKEVELLSKSTEFWNCRRLSDNRYEFTTINRQPIKIPVKYQKTDVFIEGHTEGHEIILRVINNGIVIKTLFVKIVPRNPIIHRSLEFFSPENSEFIKTLRFNPKEYGHYDFDKYVELNDYSVLSTTDTSTSIKYYNQHVKVNIRSKCGPANRLPSSIYVLLYEDVHHHALVEVWRVNVYIVKNPIMIDGFVGQTNWNLVDVGNIDSNAVAFTNNEKELQVIHSAGQTRIGYKPTHMDAGKYLMQVINTSRREVLSRHILNTRPTTPHIAKHYRDDVPVGKSQGMKLSYVNQTSQTCHYTLSTNRPNLLRFQERKFTIEPGQSYRILMRFMPLQKQETKEFLLFLNNAQDDRTIECFCITINYT
ncbi:hypothetical protein AKO1_009555 [Acrasis kona]|uniref:Nephrocystin-4 n=1 Tax=Acrasis kona TaxID=1008807 RepID=A0AAW2ZP27_9EUKA